MMVNESFSYDGKEFDIRTTKSNEKYCVKIFLNNKQVSPEYSVDFETHQDYFNQHQENLFDQLIEIAKSNIKY